MSIIDDYLQHVSPDQKVALARVRDIVKQVVPEAGEKISYGMPTLTYRQKNLIHFAAFKDHMSVYPTTEPIAALKAELAQFRVAKGTIQFTANHQLPEPIIRQLVTTRIEAIDKSYPQ